MIKTSCSVGASPLPGQRLCLRCFRSLSFDDLLEVFGRAQAECTGPQVQVPGLKHTGAASDRIIRIIREY